MRLVVVFFEEMHVVCRDKADAEFIRQINQRFGDIGVVALVALDFDEVSFGAENFEITFRDCLCCFCIAVGHLHRQLAFGAGRAGNQSLVKLCEDLLVDSRAGSKIPRCSRRSRA